jgi:hypothetical protein
MSGAIRFVFPYVKQPDEKKEKRPWDATGWAAQELKQVDAKKSADLLTSKKTSANILAC